ncbi:pentapeptide repeat-containing protein [Streptomyces bobili]|uniref:pentapeptide repeat-containing protein n=1 Tax=Streptomyces bobili TaxID=67280 RepID=UPI003416BF27
MRNLIPPLLPTPSPWSRCGQGADPATDSVGCLGVSVPGYTACLAHLGDAERTAYLATLAPGANVDHRGTPFTESLLSDLLHALRDPMTSAPKFGSADFGWAQFDGDAEFSRADFTSFVSFYAAEFRGKALFGAARFSHGAVFGEAQFTDIASFPQARFSGYTSFSGAGFGGNANYGEAQFGSHALFDKAEFKGDTWFALVPFGGDVRFDEAHFSATSALGPIVCAGQMDLSGAVFADPVTLEIAARELVCHRTRWESTATLRVRYASVDITDAVVSAPFAIASHPVPFGAEDDSPMRETALADLASAARVESVQGVDAAHMVLAGTDLSECLFIGAFHLDQIRLEGRTTFASVPQGIHRRHHVWPTRWSPRRALAEEHHWRAQAAGLPIPDPSQAASPRQWRIGPHHWDAARTPDPVDVAAIYRHLRKALEDSKNEPGAADFYYGEMEMRRHDRTTTTRAERGLLHGYWLLSGYGLRASRALGWLAASMLVTILLLMGFGLPQHSPKQRVTGTVPSGGGRVTFEIDKEDPSNPTANRFTIARFEKALNTTLNSVIFRSSGQDLTTAGTYIEMTSRLLEPTLLALAVLAVRGRIRR